MFKFCNHKCDKTENELLQKVFIEGFSLGLSKQWDMLLPTMTQNFEKMVQKIKEDAAKEAIGRFNAANKK